MDYTDNELEIIKIKKINALNDFKIIELQNDNDSNDSNDNDSNDSNNILYHDNQIETSNLIFKSFNNEKIICTMVIQPTQSGKTGCMVYIVKLFMLSNININPDNVYIITGLSSCDWKNQTKNRFPNYFKNNIYHRNDLNNFVTKFKDNYKNALIIIDEIQCASTSKKTLHKIFTSSNLYDKDFVLNNKIKIVQFSATPDGALYDLYKWDSENYKIINGIIDEKYFSSNDILNDNRLKQSQLLFLPNFKNDDDYEYEYENTNNNITQNDIINNLLELKKDVKKFDYPGYIIIRFSTKKDYYELSMNNLKEVFGIKKYNYVEFNQSVKQDINEILLNNKPNIKTFIIIKEKLRVSFTINQQYILIVYDRHVIKYNDSTIIQSLIGRCTGYNHNTNIIIYTNIQSIHKYNKLLNSNFTDQTIDWSSISTKYLKLSNELVSNNTFNNIDNFEKENDINILYDIPIIININNEEYDIICNKQQNYHNTKNTYDTTIILNIIKKYNIDIYNKLLLFTKNLFNEPATNNNNYKNFIINNINCINNNTIFKFKVNKKLIFRDAYNLYFDSIHKRIFINFYYGTKKNN